MSALLSIYFWIHIYGYKTTASSIIIVRIHPNFVSLSVQITTTKIPQSVHHTHHHTNTNTLRTLIHHSKTTNNLSQLTKCIRLTHNLWNMWVQSKKYISYWIDLIRNKNPRNQDVLLSSRGTTWLHWRLPLFQRIRLVNQKTKHFSICSFWLFLVTSIHVIWNLNIKINSNQSWCDSQSEIPFSVPPIHIT